MNIQINGQKVHLLTGTHLPDAIHWAEEHLPEIRDFVVALNGQFVPKSLYPTTVLTEDDRIEILSPMAGG